MPIFDILHYYFIFFIFFKERSFRYSALKQRVEILAELTHTLDTNQIIRRWLKMRNTRQNGRGQN
jgi:hypothetical protein